MPHDQKIVVVDDDRIYPANLIADLEAAADRLGDAAVGFSGWVVPADLTDRPTTLLTNIAMTPPVPIRARRLRSFRPVDMLQGLSGYLVRPRFFDLAELTDYSNAPEAAFFVDDVWISALCKVPKYVVPAPRAGYPGRKRKQFYRANKSGPRQSRRGRREQAQQHHHAAPFRRPLEGRRQMKTRYTIADVRASYDAQKAREEWHGDWMSALIYRPISFFLTPPLLNLSISASQVTFFALLMSFALPVVALKAGRAAHLTVAVVAILFVILDCVDGNIARVTKTASKSGHYLDFLTDIVFRIGLYAAVGILADRETSLAWMNGQGLAFGLVGGPHRHRRAVEPGVYAAIEPRRCL